MSEDGRPAAPVHSGFIGLARNPSFRMLMGGEAILLLGESVYASVLPWLMLEVTGSRSSVGWVAAAINLPYLLLAVPAGTLLDRLDRRRTMIAVTLLRILVAAPVPILYAAHALRGWHTLLIAFLISATGILFFMGRACTLPEIVSRGDLVTANTASIMLVGLARVVGASAVGAAVRLLGLGNAIGIYIAALMVCAAFLVRLRLPPRAAPSEEPRHVTGRDLLQGVSYARRDPFVRGVLLLEALYWVLGDGAIMVGFPLFVRDVLKGGPGAYGYVRAASSLGVLLGAFWLGRFGHRSHKGRVVLVGWLGYGAFLLGLPFCRTLWPALAMTFLAHLFGSMIPACEAASFQDRVPKALLGRVFGVYNMLAPGAGSISALIGGALAAFVPGGILVALGAAVSCGCAVLGTAVGLGRYSEG